MNTERKDPYLALKIPEFRTFVSSRFFITLALQMQAVVVSWQIYEVSRDPLSLGLIGLAEAVPSISVSLFAGHLADIVRRKKIIITVVGILVLCSFGLFAFTLQQDFFIRFGTLPIYIIIFISGIARGFMGPALFAFMPQLIQRENYANAITWNSTLWQTASVAGPAIGGIVYGYFGVSAAYFVDGFMLLLAFILMNLVPSKPLPESQEKQSIMESLSTGIRFVFSNKIILSAISLDLFAVLFGGAIALLPIFTAEILKVGPEYSGFLRAAPAIGSVIMALFIAYRPLKKAAGKKMLFSVAGFGVCMIIFAISKNFWLSFAILFMSGVFDSVSVIIRSTLMQTLTPDHMKGRVSSVNNIFIGSSNEIGSFESGFAAKLLGVIPSVIFGGCVTLVVVGVAAIKAKGLRRLNLD